MEEDIKKLKQEVKNFMEKYNCTLNIEGTATEIIKGKIKKSKAIIEIRS